MDTSPAFDAGDYAWTMASAALVFMMIPGIALFYSGLRRQETALSLVWVTLMSVSIVFIQWYLLGYSLAFSPFSKNNFIGDLSFAVFRNTTGPDAFAGNSAPNTPAYVYGLFQGMFSAFTAALIAGVVAERGRLIPFLVFTLFWATFVYDPIAYWIWNKNGWSNKQGGLDWAGGTPVHICSGGSALAYTLMLKYNRLLVDDRETSGNERDTWTTHLILSKKYRSSTRANPPVGEVVLKPHNMMSSLLGTLLVWFGWFGFNAGSELQANSRAASTFMASNLAACSGGMTWCLLEMWTPDTKWSGFGFCTGVFAGLVAITPGAGWVPAWAGLVFGPVVSIICYLCMRKFEFEDLLEEPLLIPIIHGLGGLIGMVCTGFFADSTVAILDGTTIPGGFLNHHYKQMVWQLAGGCAGLAWSFGISLIILIIMQIFSIPIKSLRLRADETKGKKHEIDLDDEELGGDNDAYRITYKPPNQTRSNAPRRNPSTREREHRGEENGVLQTMLSNPPYNPETGNLIQAQQSQNGAPSRGSSRPMLDNRTGGQNSSSAIEMDDRRRDRTEERNY